MIAAADELLDELFPLAAGSHADVTAYRVRRRLVARGAAPGLADPAQFAGLAADADGVAVLLRRNGLHVELTIDPEHRVGRQHHAGVADVVLESAVTTIVDLEDSVATVDGEDKAAGLPHLARPDDRHADGHVREGRQDRRARRCTATAPTPPRTARS